MRSAGSSRDLGPHPLDHARPAARRRRGRAQGSSGSRRASSFERSDEIAPDCGVEVERLLHDLAHPTRRCRSGARPRPRCPRATNVNEFMFFSSVFVRSPLSPAFADGDVRVAAQRPLLHLGVRDAELDDGLAQELQEALRLLRRTDVRLRDDLDERRAAAVEVDERGLGAVDPPAGAADVDRLRGVLLEVRPDDPDLVVAVPRRARRSARPRQSGSSYWEIW